MTRIALSALLYLPATLFAQAPNDNCSSPIAIACGQALDGTTEGATADAAPTCGATVTAPGVWYSITGNGQQITLSTCPDEQYDTKLNVYTGSCGALVCVAGNDDANGDVFCSTVSFASESGTDYLVLVQGYDGDTGPFTLTASCEGITLDVCQGALPITCNQTYTGSTESATPDAAPFCETGITAPGVWYSFVGTGQQTVISTCPDEQFDTKLNVYSGPCDALICATGNDDAAEGVFCSTATFVADAGTTYYVLVQGYNGETGPYELTVNCLTCGAPLNALVTATDVSATVTWTSTNTSATYTVEYGLAGFALGSGTIMSGTVGIDGPPVELNGLAPATDYEVYVREQCGAELGPIVGPLAFTTLTEPPAANATCGGALPIACGGEVVGNTVSGLIASAPTCASANITARGLWYGFTGNGDDATLSTCLNSGYDTKISVFTGSCSELICVAGNDDGPNCAGNTSEVAFQTTAGTEYLVLVHGYGADEGDFVLRLLCSPACVPVENDACANASELTVQPPGGCENSTGTTVCAFGTTAPNPPCDPYANIVDAWYAFNTGWVSELQLIIEVGTDGIIHAALYEACAEPEYVECWNEIAAPIDLTGLAPNTDYLVRVWNGGGSEAGSFSICVEGNFNMNVEDRIATGERIWPVPAQGIVQFSNTGAPGRYRVLDAQGRMLLQGSANPGINVIPIDGLDQGAYLLLIGEQPLGRFVKE
jgi:hypothetical protein